MEYVARLLISPNKKKFIKDGMNLVQSTKIAQNKILLPRWTWLHWFLTSSPSSSLVLRIWTSLGKLGRSSGFCGLWEFSGSSRWFDILWDFKVWSTPCIRHKVKSSELFMVLVPDTKVLQQLILTNISVLYVGVAGTGTDRDSCGDHDAHVFNLALCIWEWWSCPWGSHSLWTSNYLIFIIRLFHQRFGAFSTVSGGA